MGGRRRQMRESGDGVAWSGVQRREGERRGEKGERRGEERRGEAPSVAPVPSPWRTKCDYGGVEIAFFFPNGVQYMM